MFENETVQNDSIVRPWQGATSRLIQPATAVIMVTIAAAPAQHSFKPPSFHLILGMSI